MPDGAGIDQRDVDAAVGTQVPAGFLGLSGEVPLVLTQGYPAADGSPYYFELVRAPSSSVASTASIAARTVFRSCAC